MHIYSEKMATPRGNSGMTLIAENQDSGSFTLPLGFTLRYNNTDIVNAYSGGDSYVDFGLGIFIFYINKRDESFNKLFSQQITENGKKQLRIRFEGNSPWSPWNINNLVWELTVFEDGVFQLVMETLNTTAIGERKFYMPALNTTVDLTLEQGKSIVFIPKDKNGMDYEIKSGSYVPLPCKYLISDELNHYTITDGALTSVPIVEPLTATQFQMYGFDDLPNGNLLVPLYNPKLYMWSEQPTSPIVMTATALVPSQTVTTGMMDMSDPSIKGIRNVVCDVTGNALISISWDNGMTYEYYDSTKWMISEANGMTATTLSAITQTEWSSYLATKTSKQYQLRYIISQGGDVLKNTKFNYIN